MTRRRTVVLSVAVAVSFVILCGLGAWQVQRLGWKEALIAAAETRSTAEPTPLPPPSGWNALSRADDEYRAVTLTGTFRHEHEVHVYTVLSDARGAAHGQGYWVLTPLDLSGGEGTVIVNRGFVPEDRKAAVTREEGQVEGEVTLEGLIRFPIVGGWVTPDRDLDRNIWFTRDPAEIAEARGLAPPVAPFTIDQRAPVPPGGLPQPGETRLSFRNAHLGYAITWFGLAAALAAIYVAFLRSERRRER